VLDVSGDFLVHLAMRLLDWSAGGLLQCSAARLSVCRVVLQQGVGSKVKAPENVFGPSLFFWASHFNFR